jgi:GDPmannose 4,6-dehydratase
MKRKALITGIAGQDGSYLAELLLDLGWEVIGTIRRNSTPEHQENRISHLADRIKTVYADMTDTNSIAKVVSEIKPHTIFNLAAQSHVRVSFEIPEYTLNVNGMGALNLFEIVRMHSPESKVYQASSSEMFGTSVDADGLQRETTTMLPASPYGCAKLFAYHSARTYRDSYNLFISNGILFNHESPRRGSNFVTTKVVKEALRIFSGVSKELRLGNLNSYRDWGHSRDYVKAMYLISELQEPSDLVISTGETRSIADLCNLVFSRLGMDWREFVISDERFMRPKEVPFLRGDSNKARSILAWKPDSTFEDLIDEMLASWAEHFEINLPD